MPGTVERQGSADNEAGVEHLLAPGWLPPAVDPHLVLEAVREGQVEACLGMVTLQGKIAGNVVERLVAAYGLLNSVQGNKGAFGSRIMWETMEALGYEVSTAFPERGSDAYHLFRVICQLEQGSGLDPMARDLAYQCLGRLWAAAFLAPAGYDHYIAESLLGGERYDLSFFHPLRKPDGLSPLQEARYLRRMTDLLQAAVHAERLPSCWVGPAFPPTATGRPQWVARIEREGARPVVLQVGLDSQVMAAGSVRFVLTIADQESKRHLGHITATVLEGESGAYDEFLDLASRLGEQVERCVDSVFAAKQVVTLYPRVRELLDAAEQRLFRLLVLEEMHVAQDARGWQFASVLLSQLLLVTDMVDLAIIRPTPPDIDDGDRAQFGVQAGYARARLRLAALLGSLGGEYLLSGTMGFRLSALQHLYAYGKASRAAADSASV